MLADEASFFNQFVVDSQICRHGKPPSHITLHHVLCTRKQLFVRRSELMFPMTRLKDAVNSRMSSDQDAPFQTTV
jgi:hypothetical protein